MQYALARETEHNRQTAWQTYVADTAYYVNKAVVSIGGGTYLNDSYSKLITAPYEETKSAEEIVADVVARGGIQLI